jgi:gliding motility-associated-like protein
VATLAINAGTLSVADNTICIRQQIPAITGTQPTGGSNIGGSYTYKWEQLLGTTWTEIPNATGLNYAPSGLIQQNVSYRRKVQNSGGFEYSLPIQITAVPLPTVLITATSQTIAPGGTLTLNAQGADTWLWYSSATTASVNISTSGSYYATGTSTATTCANSDTIQITEVAVTPGVITGNEDFCVGNQATNITGTAASGGSGSGYLYKWQIWNGSAFVDTNPLKTTKDLTSIGILSETTRYRRLDADPTAPTAWSTTNEITKTIRPLPDVQNIVVITASPSTTVPPGASVVFTASGATSYRWNTFNNATTNPITQTINADQVVTLTAISSFGCEATKTQQMTATPLSPGAITTAKLSVCNNGIPALISSQTSGSGGTGSGHTYKWYENGVLVQGQNGLTYQPNAGITQTTVYRRTVVNAGVESSTGAEVSVSIAANPTFGQLVVAPYFKITPGTSVSITANATSSASGTISYAWAPSGGTVSNGNQYTVSPNSNTSYTVTATDSRPCSNSSSVTIEVSEINPGTISPVSGVSPVSICQGDIPIGMELLGYSGGSDQYSFQWQEKLSTASQWQSVGSSSTSYAPSAKPTGTMNYRVIVTDVNNTNHTRTTAVFVQTVNQRPTVTATMNKTSPVAYESVVRITGNGGQNYQFILSPSTTLSGSGNTLDFQPLLGSNSVLVIGTAANGCKDTSTMAIVANLLIKGRQTSVHPSLCAGGTLTQPIVIEPSRGGSGAFSYEWYMGTSPISASINTLVSGNGTTLNYTSPINQTTYFKRRTIDQSQGFDSSFVTINVNPIPSATITRTPSNSPIPDGATVTLQVPVVSGGSYTWAPTGGTTNGNEYTVAPVTTTTYTATVLDASGCSSTSTLQVVVDPLLPGTLNNQALCGAQAATAITGSPATGGDPSNYVYSWESRPLGGSWASITGASMSSFTPNPTPTVTTDYRRKVTNLGVSKSVIGTLTIASNPVVTVSPSATTINVGSSATLTASGASTYIWALTPTPQNGASTTVTPTINTTYSVTGKDQNGCEGSTTVAVTVVLDGGTVTTANQLVCQGAIPGLFSQVSSPTGGSGAYTYQWQQSTNGLSWTNISGAANPSFSPVQAITSTRFYRRMAFDGLTRDSSNAVTVNTVTKPTITASSNIMTIPPGASVQLSGDGAGAGNTSYQWFIGSGSVGNTQQLSVNPSITTSYILEGTSNEGCKNRDTIVINVLAINGGTIAAASSSLCIGNGGVTINNVSVASGGSGVFTYAWEVSTDGVTYAAIPGQSGISLTYTEVLNGTTYFKRKATDNAIVQYSNVAVFNVNPLPNILASTGTRNVPPGATVNLSASGGSSYTWSPQGNFSSSTNIGQTVSTQVFASQVFTVQGTDPATGCTNQDTILITVRPLVGGQIGVDQFICSGGQAERINSLTGASGGSGSYQYQWEKKEQGQTVFTDVSTATGATFIPPIQTLTTTYRRRVTDMGITANSTEVVITVSPNPSSPVTKDTVFCQSSNFSFQVSTRVTVSPGNSLRWYESATGGIANLNSPIYTGSTVGVSEYFVSQANSTTGCESVRRKVSITTRSLPNSPVVQAEQFYCEGALNPTPMSATINSQSNSLAWYDSDGTTRLSSAPTPNTAVSMQKTYYVSEVDQFTCASPRALTKSIVYRPEVTITVNQEVSCFGGQNGQLTANPSAGLAPYSYQWSKAGSAIPGADQSVLQGQTTGNYQIRILDARQCEHTASRSITQPSDITISAAAQNPLCYGDNGSITLTASGGTPVYQYSFDNGVTYQSSNSKALPFGTYRVKVKDSRGCEKTNPTNPINLVQPNAISSTFEVTNVNCWGSSDGSLKVIATGGNSTSYSYLWNDPNFQTTQTASGLDSGSYNVTVYDAVGCSRTFTKSVGTPKQIKVTGVSKQDLTCFNNTTGQISITATGGNLLNYRLNSTTPGPNSIFTGLSAAEYTLTVADSKNCFVDYQVSRAIILTQPNQLLVESITVDSVSCRTYSDGEIEILASGGNVKKYSINNGSTYSLSGTFINLTAGVYTINVTDDKNCPASYGGLSTSRTLGQPDLLVVSAITKTDLSCKNSNDGQISVTASGGNAKRYSLSGTSNLQASPLFTGLTAGLKTVTVSDVKNCPVTYNTSQVVNLLEPDSLIVSAITSTNILCKNGQNGTISITATGGNVKSYKVVAASTVFQNSSLFNGLQPNTYEVSVRDSKLCTPKYLVSRNVTLTEPDSLIVQELRIDNVTCKSFADGEVEVTATGGNTKSYKIRNIAAPQSSPVFENLLPAGYFLTVSDNNNCQVFYKKPRSFNILEPDSLYVQSKLVAPVTCNGYSDGSLELFTTGGTQPHQYSLDFNGVISSQEVNRFNNLAPGAYSASLTDANNCPSYTKTALGFTILEPVKIQVQSLQTNDVSCYNFSDGTVLFNAIGGNVPLTYSLSGDTTITQIGSIIDSLLPGLYTFQVSDSNSCPMELTPGLFAQFSINQPDPLVIYEIISNDISCHNFNDGSIVINAVGGNAPLRYSLNSGLVYGLSNVYNNLVDGIYFIKATDAKNCPVVNTPQSVTNYIVDITNPDPLASAITVVDALCHGSLDGSSEISITGGTIASGSSYQIAWRDANLNIVGFQELLDSIGSGMYTVEVRDDNQCLLQSQSFISQPDSIKVVGISSKNSKCYRSQDGEIVVNATGGSGLLYSIDAGANYQIPSIFSALDTGIYSITITDANSCVSYPSGPFQVILSEPDSFYVSGSTIKDVDCFGNASGSILIEASGGNLLEYSINNGVTWQLSSFFDSLVSGIYTLGVRDSAGCIGVSTISSSASILEPTLLVANATALQGVKCEVERLGSAQVIPSGGTLPYKIVWETGDTNFTAFGLQGFEYEFTVTDSQFCVYEGLVKVPTTDADCDSIPDFDDGYDDFDGDGIPNFRDEDSDGDLLPDIIERDLNRDGIVYDDCDNDGFPDFKDVDYCTLFIPSVFTPNGDGANDYFIIPGVEGFEDNSLVIYDRNGNLVFNQAPYKNGFNGVTNGTAFINSQDGFLPTGTYYYVLSIPSISVREIGYFYIQR